ncbi:hypothetical protein G9P44_002318 [Scheffersomyces stipitis]|nr:hypothetical protein G9P44_002318 [Scheffersomyces stipitis]
MIPLPTQDNQLLREHAFYETGNLKYVLPFMKNYGLTPNNMKPEPDFKLMVFFRSNKHKFVILALVLISALLLNLFIYFTHKVLNYRQHNRNQQLHEKQMV